MAARRSSAAMPRLLLAATGAALGAAPMRSLARAFAAPPAQRGPAARGAPRAPGGGLAGRGQEAAALASPRGGARPWGWAHSAGAALLLGALVACRQAAVDAQAVPPSRLPRDQRPKGSKRVRGGQIAQRLFSLRFRHFWDYTYNPRTYFARPWKKKDVGYAIFIGAVHLGAVAAPFHLTRDAFLVFLAGYMVTALGITLSYHRQLAHRSFTTPKLLEYAFAYCGALALQSHPINWVSSHRHHHGSTEQENDVHSPLDGFWWSHMGWLLDVEGTWMRANKSNCLDLSKQWFYRHLQRYYVLHAIVLPIAGLYALGGLPFVLWGFFARVAWVWHVTWAVNSVSHVWGFKDWNTPDNSMNNWLVAIFAFGEGWHNNHHAFENSCRHGLKWWQFDITWYIIKLLSYVGLASDLKYPSPSKVKKLTFAAT